ncbi:Rha family transcriptional regulator [Paenibacillus sp. 19GGS1-52]|uniref:Rha family transcriptional regulator n=1 Tax=Paenibacillus sp. 19GGS1-52 TaxID=2758563 RepID=UPI001EFA64D3|nr:Rha family transcriptional regulator [Paenibacillus sp. 19GGS1-52]ULO07168.1 Rha family transcriptional regulator [Paenibacillus sp. 19GGS1-52]
MTNGLKVHSLAANQEESSHFVYVENGQAMTDSRSIADKFGKRHADILRSIKTIECSPEFTERNFALSEYMDKSGRKNPYYKVTRDGFVFLITGFTGREAARFKEDYIAAFNQMEIQLQALASAPASPLFISEEAFTQMKERVQEVEQQLDHVFKEVTLKTVEQKRLHAAIGHRVILLANSPSRRPGVYRQLYRAIYTEFEVSSYRDIRKEDLEKALHYVGAWRP